MKIGELAQRAEVNIQTIRYYERRKILLPSSVRASGYRIYQERDLKKLLFIKQTQELGFTLRDIEELLRLKFKSKASCVSVVGKASAKLESVREKIRMLKGIESALKDLIVACGKNAGANSCPFLNDLDL